MTQISVTTTVIPATNKVTKTYAAGYHPVSKVTAFTVSAKKTLSASNIGINVDIDEGYRYVDASAVYNINIKIR